MTPADHIQEVLDRGTGWKLHGQWPVLEVHSPPITGRHAGTWVVVHLPRTDTWGAAYLKAGRSIDLDADAVSGRSWPFWYFSAMSGADEVEEIVRLRQPRGGAS